MTKRRRIFDDNAAAARKKRKTAAAAALLPLLRIPTLVGDWSATAAGAANDATIPVHLKSAPPDANKSSSSGGDRRPEASSRPPVLGGGGTTGEGPANVAAISALHKRTAPEAASRPPVLGGVDRSTAFEGPAKEATIAAVQKRAPPQAASGSTVLGGGDQRKTGEEPANDAAAVRALQERTEASNRSSVFGGGDLSTTEKRPANDAATPPRQKHAPPEAASGSTVLGGGDQRKTGEEPANDAAAVRALQERTEASNRSSVFCGGDRSTTEKGPAHDAATPPRQKHAPPDATANQSPSKKQRLDAQMNTAAVSGGQRQPISTPPPHRSPSQRNQRSNLRQTQSFRRGGISMAAGPSNLEIVVVPARNPTQPWNPRPQIPPTWNPRPSSPYSQRYAGLRGYPMQQNPQPQHGMNPPAPLMQQGMIPQPPQQVMNPILQGMNPHAPPQGMNPNLQWMNPILQWMNPIVQGMILQWMNPPPPPIIPGNPPPPPPGNHPPILPRIGGNWIRMILAVLACAAWAFSWLMLRYYKGKYKCSLCLYYQETIPGAVREIVLMLAVGVVLWTAKQYQAQEVRLRQIPIWVKIVFLQPLFTVVCLFLGEHAKDHFSSYIGVAWIIFAFCICLLTGYLDDFNFVETAASVTVQAIFVLQHKNFGAYAIIYFFTCILLVIKQAITTYYFQPGLPAAAAGHLPTHGVAPTGQAAVVLHVQP